MIPGRALHRLATALIPSETCERIIDAQLADFQHEWMSARSTKSRLSTLIRGYAAFWWAFPMCAVSALRKDTMLPVLQAVAMLAAVELSAALIAAAGSWVRTGAISWAEMWDAGTNAQVFAMAPWMILVQHYVRARKTSVIPMGVALLLATAWRVVHPNTQEALEHWVKGQGVFMACALFVPRLFRDRSA